jgi:hypothetical protein
MTDLADLQRFLNEKVYPAIDHPERIEADRRLRQYRWCDLVFRLSGIPTETACALADEVWGTVDPELRRLTIAFTQATTFKFSPSRMMTLDETEPPKIILYPAVTIGQWADYPKPEDDDDEET